MRIVLVLIAAAAAVKARFLAVDPVFTPFRHDNGHLNLSAVPGMANASRSQGADVVLLGGSTGDWPSLSVDERIELLKSWSAALDAMRDTGVSAERPMKLLFHAGHTDVEQARQLAAAAEEHGADAILAVAPGVVYRPPAGLEGARQVAQQLGYIAAGAPSLPLWYYHFPGLYTVDVDVPALVSYALTGEAPPSSDTPLALASLPATAINRTGHQFPISATTGSEASAPLAPTLHGIKYIDTNVDDVQRALRIAKRAGEGNFSVYIKNPLAVACLPIGCDGAPVQTLGARVQVELGQAWDRGDVKGALDAQFKLLELADVFGKYGAL